MTKIQKDNKNLAKVPNLRFPGFEGEWETKKLGEIGEIVNGLTYSPNDIAENGVLVLRSSNVQNRSLAFEDNVYVRTDNYNPVQENDILICVRNGSKNLIGKNALINRENEGVAFGAFMSIYRSSFNKFLFHWFDTNEYKEIVHKNLGATINSINGSDLRKFKVPFPSMEEQEKIASFLSIVDERIQTQNKIIEQLETLIKGLSEKLFSQKIRFKEFTEKWEVKTLSDVLVKFEEITTRNNQYPILTSARTGIFFQKDYFDGNEVASKDNRGYNIVPRGYFTYRHMSDDTTFKFNINTICDHGIVSTLYPVFTTNGVNDYFLKIYLNDGQAFKNYALLQKQGGSRTYMYYNKLTKLKLRFPNLEEQTKIASFLIKIDQKSQTEKAILEQIENQKKYLLNHMFV